MARYVRVINATQRTVLAERCRVATSMRDRMVGLLGTAELGRGHGLLIERTQSIHMFFMRYAIDAVFVDATGRVTKVVANLAPWRVVGWARGARDCVELPAGAAAAARTVAGDRLAFEPHLEPAEAA